MKTDKDLAVEIFFKALDYTDRCKLAYWLEVEYTDNPSFKEEDKEELYNIFSKMKKYFYSKQS